MPTWDQIVTVDSFF